ncbi:PhzF family phenazine biosynthesis protein [Streptomyces acidiscabies]|uniref:PhzF family phenazine biosynthesis protein n=1 Tax=Streptomyces acidiscabies TaxID=42234 RepID=A0ABU4MBV7_9ACTN|nr:PhzF family phenazine biosynthesis protein [Streptomyces acidiscabies]MDX3024984.1 PhzF family phenazine biosynthesis protein [Streptomyces acidiscabies]
MHYDLCDVFAQQPLSGNQLAVFTDDAPLPDDDFLQAVAREMNLSESVFLTAPSDGGDARVRMFSTVTEIDFAGHPLLGTAAVLAHRQGRASVSLRIETNVGPVPVTVTRQGAGRYTAAMDQPIPRIASVPDDVTARLLAVLGLARSELPVVLYDAGIPHLYIVADSPDAVRAIQPDFPALGKAAGPGRPRINVCALTGPASALTRMFSPHALGMPEDPACGSAAGPLAAHLVHHGLLPSGTELTLSQGESVGRPSVLHATANVGPTEIQSITVAGGVCIIGSGQLHLSLIRETPEPARTTASR